MNTEEPTTMNSMNKSGSTPLRFFTICARNFLPNAKMLGDSVLLHHPEAIFTVYLCDRDFGYDPSLLGLNIASLEALGIPALDHMIRFYNITELCTAIKPYCVLREFAVHEDNMQAGTELNLVYLDPDIEIFSPLEEVVESLDGGAQLVLTPHVINPAERTESSDQQFLKMGVYNLGFLAVRYSEQVAEVMRWWARRLVDQCTIDLAEGLFVDQKWADLFPAFLDDIKIIRHPGYNVAYWNLHERRIDGPLDALRCNGLPLRFVHYSGIIVEHTERLSRHSNTFFLSNSFGYGPLVERYRSFLNSPENQRFRDLPYGFFWNGAKGRNAHTPGASSTSWRQPHTFLFARQFFSKSDYQDYLRQEARAIATRREYEAALVPKETDEESFTSPGYCYLCASDQQLISSFLYANEKDACGRAIPNWREHLTCPSCRIPNRLRASIHLFLQEFEPADSARIYITERKTAVYDWLSVRFRYLVGSEYFGDHVGRGALCEGVRNENLERLSFQSRIFDFILSFDILEHVVDPTKAFSEAFRVLRPGGWMIFTAPAYLDRDQTTVRAEMLPNGRIHHHLEPEYHGNPVDHEGGALCFRYFGWDVMAQMKAAGFLRPFVFSYWSERFGYLGPDQVLFVAQRPE
jgi:SAM-dependent methyltransferase